MKHVKGPPLITVSRARAMASIRSQSFTPYTQPARGLALAQTAGLPVFLSRFLSPRSSDAQRTQIIKNDYRRRVRPPVNTVDTWLSCHPQENPLHRPRYRRSWPLETHGL